MVSVRAAGWAVVAAMASCSASGLVPGPPVDAAATDAAATLDLAAPADLAMGPDLDFCGSRTVSFGALVDSPTGQFTARPGRALAVADLDGDGRMDVAQVASADRGLTQALLVLRGKGDGSLAVAATRPLPVVDPDRAVNVVAADFNRDGRSDVAVADWRAVMVNGHTLQAGWTVLLGDGSPGLGAARSSWGPFPSTGYFPDQTPSTLGDFNGDGAPDLVACYGTLFKAPQLVQWTNNGDGTLASRPVAPNVYRLLEVADFNEDGADDLAARQSQEAQEIALYPSDGSGQLALRGPAYQPSSFGGSMAAGDVNGDGHADLVSLTALPQTPGGASQVLLGDGRGQFRSVPLPVLPTGLTLLADLDGDGGADLVVADPQRSAIRVMGGRCDGTFGPPQSFAVGGPIDGLNQRSVVIADMNGDRQPDLVVARTDRRVTVLLNTTR